METAAYVAALKQKSRKVVALALRATVAFAAGSIRANHFLAAVFREAAQYGLYTISTAWNG